MRFKSNFNTKRNIFDPGFLSQLAEDIISGKPGTEIKKLTTDEMHRLPEIYGSLPFEGGNILDCIEDDAEYVTSNKKIILGRDVKAITLLMYMKPRTAYWKPDRPQIHDTSMCGAVPIPMLGLKRFKDIPYSNWDNIYGEFVNIDSEDNELNISFTEDIIEGTFEIDLLLGHTLASTRYNDVEDLIEWDKRWGLQLLSYVACRPNYNDVRYFRKYGMGNHKGSFASVYGTASIPKKVINEENSLNVSLYNQSTTAMRLMLAQRWAWYGNHRNNDMICDFQDWDNIPKSVDTMSQELHGHTPVKSVLDFDKFKFGGK